MRQALALLAAALLAGCVSSGPREAERYFILDAAPGAQAKSGVVVAPTSAATFYDTQDIVYSRAPGTRAYYQFNRWTERPQRAIHARLASRLEGPRSTVILKTHLDEIYHDAAQPPGVARIAITAQLVDPAGSVVIARRNFSAAAAAASYDAAGAVQGFRQALGALLDDVVGWVERVQAGREK